MNELKHIPLPNHNDKSYYCGRCGAKKKWGEKWTEKCFDPSKDKVNWHII